MSLGDQASQIELGRLICIWIATSSSKFSLILMTNLDAYYDFEIKFLIKLTILTLLDQFFYVLIEKFDY